MAPAPTQSSNAGRRPPSRQRSPAGMTAIRRPYSWAAAATARPFLRQPVSVGVAPVPKLRVAPLGDGSTNRVPRDMDTNDVGDSEYLVSRRCPSASSAPSDAAKRAADLSF